MLVIVLATTRATTSDEDVDPATRLAGLSLLARLVLTVQHAGASRVAVLGDARLEPLMTELRADPRVSIELERVAPGSLAERLEGLEEPVVLAPWDRVVDGRVYAGLLAAELGSEAALFAAHEGELLGPVLADARAIAADLDAILGQAEPPVLEVDGWAEPARSPEGRARAERRLFEACRKSQDGLVSRHFNRHVSLAISRLLVNTPITPNQMTVATFAVALVACALAYQGGYAYTAAAGVLMQLNSILDGCDGELARVRWQGSKLGQWLDTLGDDLSNVLFWAALGFGARSLPTWGPELSLVAWGTAALNGLAAVQYYLLLARTGSGDLYALAPHQAKNPDSFVGKVVEAVATTLKQDFFLFLTMCLALAGVLYQALPLFALGAFTTFLAATLHTLRSLRRPGR
jgi:phosphatidylglycerophosphate synthase